MKLKDIGKVFFSFGFLSAVKHAFRFLLSFSFEASENRDKMTRGDGTRTHTDQNPSEQHQVYAMMETISTIFDRLQMLSSPEEWLEQRKRGTIVACRQVLMSQSGIVSYEKNVESGPASAQEQRDKAKFFQHMFEGIRKSIPLASYPTSSRAAKDRRLRRNRRVYKRRGAVVDYGHERNHVPVLYKNSNNTATDYPSVSKLPALNIDVLRGVSKSIEDFVNRFLGVNSYRCGRYFDFAHEAMFSPGPVLLESSMAYKDFKKLARNIFVSTKTQTTLVFLGGVESYRQVDMLFSAAVGAIPRLAKHVGVAECIAFYPDLMCAEYDFIGLGLRELLQDNRYNIVDIKIDCIKGLDRESVFRYRKDLSSSRFVT